MIILDSTPAMVQEPRINASTRVTRASWPMGDVSGLWRIRSSTYQVDLQVLSRGIGK